MDHRKAPIYDRLIEHRGRGTHRFHVPGHKGGGGTLVTEREFRAVLEIDLTEIPGLDDLHQPEGVIEEAQRLAADVFGAAHTFFLVGGSTAGILALMLTVGRSGRPVIVQRNAHKSIMNGLMLAGARAVFVAPRIDPASGLPGGADAQDVAEALRRYPDAAAVVLTNPNYYGMGVDLRPLVDLAHARGVPVIVDEAHGAHYGHHPDLPASALAAGADGVVQSTHKMLTAMTMGAMLHLGDGGRIDPADVQQALRIVQSSSPSYPILASLDLCRRQLALRGAELFDEALRVAAELRGRLAAMPRLDVLAVPRDAARAAFTTLDPLKLTLREATGSLSGFELLEALDACGCVAELADPRHVLLALGPATAERDAAALIRALERILRRLPPKRPATDGAGKQENAADPGAIPAISEPIQFGVRFTDGGGKEGGRPALVELREAAGRIAAEPVVPYPPGVPLLLPGERITADAAEQLKRWRSAGARIHGITADGRVKVWGEGRL